MTAAKKAPVSRESFQSAQESESDKTLSKTLKAMAALAMVASPQLVNAAEASEQIAAEMVEEKAQDPSVVDTLEGVGDNIKDRAKRLKESLDPNGYLNDRTVQLGDYELRFRPMDVDLKPKLKSGTPGLRLKGEFLETSIAKKEDVGNGWTRRQGLTAKIEGEVTTYDEPELDLHAGVFREYTGKVAEDYDARFSTTVGLRHRFVGGEEGLRAGVGFRQIVEGGKHEFMGHDYQLYAEGRQGAYYNFDKGETDLSYSFMVGPKKDWDVKVFGQKGKLTITAGPEIKGSTSGDAFEPGFKTKVRFRLTK